MISWSKIYYNSHLLTDKLFYRLAEAFGLLETKICLGLLTLLNLTIWGFTWLFYNQVKGGLIVLHYNTDFGVDLIGEPKNLFIIPMLGLFIGLFNFILLLFFVKNSNFKILAYIILGAAILANIFLSLALGPLYLINFS